MALGTILSEVPNPSRVLRIPSDLLTTSKSLPKKKTHKRKNNFVVCKNTQNNNNNNNINNDYNNTSGSLRSKHFRWVFVRFSLFERAVKKKKTNESEKRTNP